MPEICPGSAAPRHRADYGSSATRVKKKLSRKLIGFMISASSLLIP
jgi:hypothetical protein